MTDARSIALDLTIDVVCPWCFIGKARLEAAMAAVPEIDFTLRHRPFQLDPTLPPEGRDHRATMLAKFGSAERVAAAEGRVSEIGRSLGLPIDFGRVRVSPNTLDAHRLIRWAREAGRDGAAVDRLYRLFFCEGADIGDRAVLADAAAAIGLDRAEIAARLATDRDRGAVEAEIAAASAMGITGVPFLVIDGRYGVSGAQEAEVLADAFLRIAAAKAA